MSKRIYSVDSIFGGADFYDESGNLVGYSVPGIFGGQDYYGTNGKTMYSVPSIISGEDFYGENGYVPVDDANAEEGTGQGYAGFLEQSNVSVVDEMVNMIAVQRNYDTNQKMITTIDDTLDKAVNQIGTMS